jgi:hypothetical protein
MIIGRHGLRSMPAHGDHPCDRSRPRSPALGHALFTVLFRPRRLPHRIRPRSRARAGGSVIRNLNFAIGLTLFKPDASMRPAGGVALRRWRPCASSGLGRHHDSDGGHLAVRSRALIALRSGRIPLADAPGRALTGRDRANCSVLPDPADPFPARHAEDGPGRSVQGRAGDLKLVRDPLQHLRVGHGQRDRNPNGPASLISCSSQAVRGPISSRVMHRPCRPWTWSASPAAQKAVDCRS